MYPMHIRDEENRTEMEEEIAKETVAKEQVTHVIDKISRVVVPTLYTIFLVIYAMVYHELCEKEADRLKTETW